VAQKRFALASPGLPWARRRKCQVV
jgi:hypothetical protein